MDILHTLLLPIRRHLLQGTPGILRSVRTTVQTAASDVCTWLAKRLAGTMQAGSGSVPPSTYMLERFSLVNTLLERCNGFKLGAELNHNLEVCGLGSAKLACRVFSYVAVRRRCGWRRLACDCSVRCSPQLTQRKSAPPAWLYWCSVGTTHSWRYGECVWGPVLWPERLTQAHCACTGRSHGDPSSVTTGRGADAA